MSRSGYTEGGCDDQWGAIRWRGIVASAARGARGQAMLGELLDSLDAMPVKELHEGALVTQEGCCCTIGALLVHREVPYLDEVISTDATDEYAQEDWNERLADDLDVATPLIQEIAWENDEGGYRETPAQRWTRMRAWVARQIKKEEASA